MQTDINLSDKALIQLNSLLEHPDVLPFSEPWYCISNTVRVIALSLCKIESRMCAVRVESRPIKLKQ